MIRMKSAIGWALGAVLCGAAPASAYQLCVTSDQPIVYARIGDGLVVALSGTGHRCTSGTSNPTGSGPITAGANLNWLIDCGLTVPPGNLATIEFQFRVVYSGTSAPPVPTCTP